MRNGRVKKVSKLFLRGLVRNLSKNILKLLPTPFIFNIDWSVFFDTALHVLRSIQTVRGAKVLWVCFVWQTYVKRVSSLNDAIKMHRCVLGQIGQ